jgi:hypothetical protein
MTSPMTRLAECMDARRLDLGLTWDEVSTESRVHRETIRSIRNRETGSIRPLTKRGLERALHWRPGSIDKILSGGDPTPLEREPESPAAPSTAQDREMQLLVEIREAVEELQRLRGERAEPDTGEGEQAG